MKDRNEAKLPLWAQRRIAQLRGSVQHWKDNAYSVSGAGATHESNVAVTDMLEERKLPKNSRLRITLDDGTLLDLHFPSVNSAPKGALAVSSRNGQVEVLPGASNVVYIRGTRW